jgi:hypothetical protein
MPNDNWLRFFRFSSFSLRKKPQELFCLACPQIFLVLCPFDPVIAVIRWSQISEFPCGEIHRVHVKVGQHVRLCPTKLILRHHFPIQRAIRDRFSMAIPFVSPIFRHQKRTSSPAKNLDGSAVRGDLHHSIWHSAANEGPHLPLPPFVKAAERWKLRRTQLPWCTMVSTYIYKF